MDSKGHTLMSTPIALLPDTLSELASFSQRRRRWRDWTRALPHRHAWPEPLSNAEVAALRHLPLAIRQRPMAVFADSPHHRVHLGHLQNRRIGVLTVGDCVDAELAQELGTWAGVGPTLAHWIRATLLRLAAQPDLELAASPPSFPLQSTPQPNSLPVS